MIGELVMDEYLLFVDETKPSRYIPYFCFSGISIERNYYEDTFVPAVNALKKKHFGKTDVIFHFADMKKNKKAFEILLDTKKRDDFWNDFTSLIKESQIDIIGIYFNDAMMSNIYCGNPHSNYDVGFCVLLDNYMHYLKSKQAYGQICVESRTLKENSYLQKSFYEYIQNGSIYFSKEDTQKYLTSLGFTVKGDNCIGLQIADIAPSQLLRYKQNFKKDFYGLAKTLGTKIYNVNTNYEDILGFKKIL